MSQTFQETPFKFNSRGLFCTFIAAALIHLALREAHGQTTLKKRPPVTRVAAEEAEAPRRPLPRVNSADNAETTDGPSATSKPKESSGKKPRPEAVPYRIPKLSSELELILKNWEVASSKINRLSGKHYRIVYDSTFEVETHAEGTYLYEAPDKGYFAVSPVKIGPKEEGKKFKKKVSAKSERWVCNGQEVFVIDDEAKTYRVIIIPPESRGENIIDGPLPFLFGMKAEKAKMRYDFALIKQVDDPPEIWLLVKPLLQQDAANWKEAQVIINAKTYLPKAVRLVNPNGASVTVHSFPDPEVNKARWPFQSDPLKPNLKNYKVAVNPEPAPPPRAATKPRALPSTGNSPVRSADSSGSGAGTTPKKTTPKSVRN